MKLNFLLRHLKKIWLAAVAASLLLPSAVVAARIPNDTYFNNQWYLKQINAPDAWQYSLGMENVVIAIIDSGVDLDHPDLKDNIWRNMDEVAGDGIDNDGNGYIDDVYGWDFVDDDNDPNPDLGFEYSWLGANHGTISAGIASAKGDNGQGVVGVTWQAPIMVLRALDSTGSGDPTQVAAAVDYAVANGAKVINLSFVGPMYSSRLAEALHRAYDRGVFVVAAAGNAPEGGSAVNLDVEPMYPVCFDRDSNENFVYGVVATDHLDHKAKFSNYGASCVDISAPGEKIVSTQFVLPDNKNFSELYGGYFNGTSVATPMVAGLAALMYSLDKTLTPKQVMNILTETSVNIDAFNPSYIGRLGRGRIDAAKAVKKVLERLSGLSQTASPTPTVQLTSSTGGGGHYIVTAPGRGRAGEIKIFTSDGLYIRSFDAFAHNFTGGVSLAIGNFDGTNKSIVTAVLSGGSSQIRIFDINTRLIGAFLAYDPAFLGGVEVAAADLNRDGLDEIVTGAGPGGGPHVRIFDKRGQELGSFFAFEEKFRGGIDVAAGDLDGDGVAEIVVAPKKNKSEVRIFNAKGVYEYSLFPFGTKYKAEMQVDVDDVNNDGMLELIARGRLGNSTKVVVYDGKEKRLAEGGDVFDAMRAVSGSLASTSFNTSGTKANYMVWGCLSGDTPVVTMSSGLKFKLPFWVYEKSFRGGVQARVIN